MVEKESIEIGENDYLNLYVIGYRNQGESIILSIGNKFVGVIDCFKVNNIFKTKYILDEIKAPLDFICWTHCDWDHTYGISELTKYIDDDTVFLIPEGMQSKDIRNLFEDKKDYKFQEYSKIYDIIDNMDNLITVNEHSSIYSFKIKHHSEEFQFSMNCFAPLGRKIRKIEQDNLINTTWTDKESFAKKWFEGCNKLNNLFSVGLQISIKANNENIRICLTGDLDNEMICEMRDGTINSIFGTNTIIKIPHHGSENASELVKYKYSNTLKFNYAISTSFKVNNKSLLPKDDILNEYTKYGQVCYTNKDDKSNYGIVKYVYPLVRKLDVKYPDEIQFEGDAGRYYNN